jgi:hypothetical protein
MKTMNQQLANAQSVEHLSTKMVTLLMTPVAIAQLIVIPVVHSIVTKVANLGLVVDNEWCTCYIIGRSSERIIQ